MNEATAGAALKYHIKRALERSHSISDFSKQLELSAKNSQFTNNTLKIIEELNNGVKQASDELKEKVTKYEKALKELQKIDESKLTKEQQQVLKVFKGELDQTEIKGIDLNDLYILEQGSRNAGARKILRKHYGEESTGGLTNEELLNMSEVIKNGSVLLESFERIKNGFRYAYEWENNGVKLRLVVDDLNNGNKIFDFYSDRNFTDFRDASLHSGNHPYEPNLTQKPLTSQEDLLKTPKNALKDLSPLEQAQAEKLAKLESERLDSEKEFARLKEQEQQRKAALKKKLEHERGNAGNIESQTKIEVGEDIPTNTQASDAVNSLMKIIKAQGQKDLSNYKALTKGLNESDKERLELTILNRLAEESLKQDEALKVFDSAHFFNKLNEFKDEVFSTPKAKEYIDIASGFHKLFKNDAKIAESLKPATTKNLSQGLATTLSGALKYQWTKFTLGTLYRNAPDRILGIKLPKALNEATAGAALKYHIKRALERSHSISDFSKQLELSAKNSQFTNNTLKIIEELNNGVKQASDELKEATKPSNLVKSIREQDTRPFEVIEDKEAFLKDLNQNLKANATPLPKGMSVEEFKKSLESVENKERFLEHLETRSNSDERLAALNLVEPIIREPHIEIFTKDKNSATDKKEYIKAFKDENKARLYMLITQDNDTILRTFIPKLNERYMRSHVRDADIIHSFIQPNRTAKSDNALSTVVVYGENTTQKPLTSQEDLLKTPKNALKDLSPLEQAQAEKLAKLESERLDSEKEFTRLKEQEQARKSALKKKLEHERGNAGNIESQTKIEVG
ncbi:DUF3519 domain-containing protein, partial [Helicobacter pylori]|uniref:DUF3519 domain-containing protein n=3 Tax=Helicobacter pylori TaxID=210 RepID=UPI002F36000E